MTKPLQVATWDVEHAITLGVYRSMSTSEWADYLDSTYQLSSYGIAQEAETLLTRIAGE